MPQDKQPAIHPDVAAIVAAARAAGSRPFEAMSVSDARAAHASRPAVLQPPPDPVGEAADRLIDGPAGPLLLRLYRGRDLSPDATSPAILFCHGGGWVLGSLDTHDWLCRRLANEARCRVVSVDYRLAPEHPFPAAIDDAAAAFRFVGENAAALGVDPARIAVAGDSAGGNLAAVLALMGRDGSVPPPVFQALLYPSVDLTFSEPSSTAAPSPGMTITPATMRWFIDHYMPAGTDRSDPRASPLLASSLAGTAPALVLTCGHDPLRDEGRAYARRLADDGVPVIALDLSDQTHAILTMGKVVGITPAIVDFVAAALQDAFRRPGMGRKVL